MTGARKTMGVNEQAPGASQSSLVRTRKEHFVRNLFDSLSPTYDLLNSLASFGLHRRWRARALRAANLRSGEKLVDFCCGTGDFLELAVREFGTDLQLIGLDFSERMLEVAQARLSRYDLDGRLSLLLRNVEETGLPEACADVATCGFALRNVNDLHATFAEMFRVLRPGGRVALVELSQPDRPWIRRAFWFYMDWVLPLLVRPLVRRRDPLRYLSASIRGFRTPPAVAELLREVGFDDVRIHSLFLGVCRVYLGVKPLSAHTSPGSQSKPAQTP